MPTPLAEAVAILIGTLLFSIIYIKAYNRRKCIQCPKCKIIMSAKLLINEHGYCPNCNNYIKIDNPKK